MAGSMKVVRIDVMWGVNEVSPTGVPILLLLAMVFGCSAALAENLVPNSSFEIAANPSHPDCWGDTGGPEIVPYHEATRDCTQAYHGRASVRIKMKPNKWGAKGRGWRTRLIQVPAVEPNTAFVLSAYLKSDVPEVEIYLGVRPGEPQQRSFKVTPSWQRYACSLVIKKKDAGKGKTLSLEFGPRTTDKEYTYWIDAVQLETGQTAGPYAPSALDVAGGYDAKNGRELAGSRAKMSAITCQNLSLAYRDRLQGVCQAVFYLRNSSGRAEDLDLALELSQPGDPAARRAQVVQRLRADPGDQRVTITGIRFPIETGNPKRYHSVLKAAIKVKEARSGKVVFQEQYDHVLVPPLFDAYVERNYYTTEPKTTVIGVLDGLPPERGQELSLQVSLPGGPAGATTLGVLKGAATEVEIPIGKMAPGRHPCTIALRRNGQEIARVEKELVKLEPGKVEVKIDRRRQCLVVEGKPFLPYFLGLHAPQHRPHMWQEMADRGFNGCITSFDLYNVVADNEQIRQSLDIAQRHGLKVIIWLFQRNTDKTRQVPLWEVTRTYAERIVPAVRDHPAVIGYMYADEWWDAVYSRQLYEACRQLDPYKPVFHTQCSNFATWDTVARWHPRWAETLDGTSWWELKDYFTDIVAWDVYPFAQIKPGYSLERTIDDSVNRVMKVMAAADRKPMFFWGQSLYYGSGAIYREPTPSEETGEFYQLLINGVRGEMYFYYKPEARELWDRYRQQASELKVLTPVLLSAHERTDIYSTSPDIRLTARSYDGKLYLVTSNLKPAPAETEFVLGDLTATKCDVLFERRSIEPDMGRFRDKFAPYERHVYVLTPP